MPSLCTGPAPANGAAADARAAHCRDEGQGQHSGDDCGDVAAVRLPGGPLHEPSPLRRPRAHTPGWVRISYHFMQVVLVTNRYMAKHACQRNPLMLVLKGPAAQTDYLAYASIALHSVV